MSAQQTRIDRWLWAVRLYKTRAVASDACKGGHVEINGHPAKPASTVKVGDRVKARTGSRVRELEVVKIIEKRVGAPVAAECVIDHTPAPIRSSRCRCSSATPARAARRSAIAASWTGCGPLARSRLLGGGRVSDDYGHAIGFEVLRRGTPVISSDGVQIGTVRRVSNAIRERIFDGLTIDTPDGQRFLDAPRWSASSSGRS